MVKELEKKLFRSLKEVENIVNRSGLASMLENMKKTTLKFYIVVPDYSNLNNLENYKIYSLNKERNQLEIINPSYLSEKMKQTILDASKSMHSNNDSDRITVRRELKEINNGNYELHLFAIVGRDAIKTIDIFTYFVHRIVHEAWHSILWIYTPSTHESILPINVGDSGKYRFNNFASSNEILAEYFAFLTLLAAGYDVSNSFKIIKEERINNFSNKLQQLDLKGVSYDISYLLGLHMAKRLYERFGKEGIYQLFKYVIKGESKTEESLIRKFYKFVFPLEILDEALDDVVKILDEYKDK
ncbi:MAG: hypothetical protein QXP34_00045 [Candidatus Aenigmatarchaeota archaeon]